mmetsp:Transcript_49185/g.101438  ORF Transcript_49185/g.101438 Transcript_49185/m.101438 type:complete len:211 (-) Transcript_49185:231-863(-)
MSSRVSGAASRCDGYAWTTWISPRFRISSTLGTRTALSKSPEMARSCRMRSGGRSVSSSTTESSQRSHQVISMTAKRWRQRQHPWNLHQLQRLFVLTPQVISAARMAPQPTTTLGAWLLIHSHTLHCTKSQGPRFCQLPRPGAWGAAGRLQPLSRAIHAMHGGLPREVSRQQQRSRPCHPPARARGGIGVPGRSETTTASQEGAREGEER